MTIEMITDFTNQYFRAAFIEYFNELGIEIECQEDFFEMMTQDESNQAFIMRQEEMVISFLQFKFDQFDHWFFKESFCFVREFWVSPHFRNKGIGSLMLNKLEDFSLKNRVFKIILTTDTADQLYLKNGYFVDKSYIPKNNDTVYCKVIY